ncbi:MAG: SPOR domain-containing protein [Chitinispirillaceae bacterium]|jgi:cell division septation protein DedD|nr:SPOR domain-containing protein [Chitinispirillaceae bacterium]
MTVRITSLVIIAVSSVLIVGCDKPKPVSRPAPAAAVAEQTKPDSVDVFSELYSDSAAGGNDSARIQDQTFSLKSSDSFPMQFEKNGAFTVQVASVRGRGYAGRMARRFTEQGFPAYVIEVQDPTPAMPGIFYRVRIGRFATRAAATAFCENVLRPAGIEYWVDRTANESAVQERVPRGGWADTTTGW